MLPGETAPPVTRVFRFDVSAELTTPTGEDYSLVHNSAKAIRLGWFGSNPTPNFAVGLSSRIVLTEPVRADETLLFFDMIGLYLRLAVPVAPGLKGFVEADPSLVGMHVRCENPTDALCNDDGNEFVLRGGITGRVGGLYELVPGRLDLNGYLALEKTIPDDGGWFSIGVGLTAHTGPTHIEMKRRQQALQQQRTR